MSKHVQKTLNKMTKKSSTANANVDDFKNQYKIIRNDLIKLKDDLQKGYDMAKGAVEKKGLINQILNGKQK